jgi:hypothetical protein
MIQRKMIEKKMSTAINGTPNDYTSSVFDYGSSGYTMESPRAGSLAASVRVPASARAAAASGRPVYHSAGRSAPLGAASHTSSQVLASSPTN